VRRLAVAAGAVEIVLVTCDRTILEACPERAVSLDEGAGASGR
jgi:hypothetical protein